MRSLSLLTICFVWGCGSPSTDLDAGSDLGRDGGPDAGALDLGAPDLGIDALVMDATAEGGPSTVYPAPHPSPPQLVDAGGPVLATPHIHAVTFASDDPPTVASIGAFVAGLGTTAYYRANVTEYGVGDATGDSIALTDVVSGTVDDADVQTWLAGRLNADDPAFGAPDASTLYAVFYPAGVSVTVSGSRGCVDFGGYHSSITLDATHASRRVAYVVVPRCADFVSLTGIDATTAIASAQLLDAVTDPFPNDAPAWATPDDAHLSWLFALGAGEICGLCAEEPSALYRPTGFDYEVQRCWSNAAAAAGHDPCVPATAGTPYFGAAPELPDTVTLGGAALAAVRLPAGGSATTTIDLFSDATTAGPMTVTALDGATSMGGTPVLVLSLDRTSGLNGEHLTLTLHTVDSAHYTQAFFFVQATVGTVTHTWVGLAGE